VAEHLGELLGRQVRLARDWIDGVDVSPGEVVMCENVRFNIGEKKDDETLSRKMAALCDIYVMDAFGTAHRAQASTHGVGRFAPVACGGPLLVAELEALSRALEAPARPLVAIVGGSKVSTKLSVLNTLTDKVDQLIVGGGIANNFLAAQGHPVGKSLYEPDLVTEAQALIEKARARGAEIPVPTDVRVATEFSESAAATVKDAGDVGPEDMILDVGPATEARYGELLRSAGTIVWNGPVGVFEFDAFAGGTRAAAQALVDSEGFSIVGGGDSAAAVRKLGFDEAGFGHISTGGGASLELLEGKTLPGIAVLED